MREGLYPPKYFAVEKIIQTWKKILFRDCIFFFDKSKTPFKQVVSSKAMQSTLTAKI